MQNWNNPKRINKKRRFVLYTRRCVRCGKLYKTQHRKSSICTKCYLPNAPEGSKVRYGLIA